MCWSAAASTSGFVWLWCLKGLVWIHKIHTVTQTNSPIEAAGDKQCPYSARLNDPFCQRSLVLLKRHLTRRAGEVDGLTVERVVRWWPDRSIVVLVGRSLAPRVLFCWSVLEYDNICIREKHLPNVSSVSRNCVHIVQFFSIIGWIGSGCHSGNLRKFWCGISK